MALTRAGVNPVLLVDVDGNPISSLNPLPIGATIQVGDIEIGAVEIKNDTDDTRAKVGPGTSANALRSVTSSNDPLITILGATNGAAVITDADATIQQYLRGLVKQWIAGTLVIGAGGNRIGKVGHDASIVGGSFTRPSDSTPYSLGDLIANNTDHTLVTPITVPIALGNDGKARINRIRLTKSTTSLMNANFRVHAFKDNPTIANGDNAAFSVTESTHIASFNVAMDRAFSDKAKGFGVPMVGDRVIAAASSGTVNTFWLIEARGLYTPGNQEIFTLAVELDEQLS